VSEAAQREEARFREAMAAVTPRHIMARARSIRAQKMKREPNWVLAMSLFSLGSTFAWMLCREQDIDPEGLTVNYHGTAALAQGGHHEA
jgi:hypothetical protein